MYVSKNCVMFGFDIGLSSIQCQGKSKLSLISKHKDPMNLIQWIKYVNVHMLLCYELLKEVIMSCAWYHQLSPTKDDPKLKQGLPHIWAKMGRLWALCGTCHLAAIVGAIHQVPSHVVESLQLISRWGISIFYQRVPNFQLSYIDFTEI